MLSLDVLHFIARIVRLSSFAVFLLGGVVFLPGPLAAMDVERAPPAFFSALPDVPLMEGLVEMPEQSLEYDKPQGRVIESVAEMQGVTVDAVDVFYRETLPQFGWTRLEAHKFVRGRENLRFFFEQNDEHSFVRIMLTPR